MASFGCQLDRREGLREFLSEEIGRRGTILTPPSPARRSALPPPGRRSADESSLAESSKNLARGATVALLNRRPSTRDCSIERDSLRLVQVVPFVIDHEVEDGAVGKSRRSIDN
jgi:hypothetical protein